MYWGFLLKVIGIPCTRRINELLMGHMQITVIPKFYIHNFHTKVTFLEVIHVRLPQTFYQNRGYWIMKVRRLVRDYSHLGG